MVLTLIQVILAPLPFKPPDFSLGNLAVFTNRRCIKKTPLFIVIHLDVLLCIPKKEQMTVKLSFWSTLNPEAWNFDLYFKVETVYLRENWEKHNGSTLRSDWGSCLRDYTRSKLSKGIVIKVTSLLKKKIKGKQIKSNYLMPAVVCSPADSLSPPPDTKELELYLQWSQETY